MVAESSSETFTVKSSNESNESKFVASAFSISSVTLVLISSVDLLSGTVTSAVNSTDAVLPPVCLLFLLEEFSLKPVTVTVASVTSSDNSRSSFKSSSTDVLVF